MKCPSCNTLVVKIPVNWKCPRCNERLPDPTVWQRIGETLTEYLEDKGAIFYGILLGFMLITIGVFEMVFGRASLLSYIGSNFLFSAMMLLYGGMVLDMYMKMVMPLRLVGGGDFLFRERAVIRNMRKGSHIALIVGLLVAVIGVGFETFLEYFPSWFVVIGCCLSLSWAIGGLFLDPRMLEDVRFRAYLDRLGITSLKRLRRISAAVIALILMTALGYWLLTQIPRLPHKIGSWEVVGVLLRFFQSYLAWLL